MTTPGTIPRLGIDSGIISRLFEAAAPARKRRATAKVERRLERAMAAAFRAQGRAFLARFAKLKGSYAHLREAALEDEWSPLFAAAALETEDAFGKPLDAAAAAALRTGAEGLADQLAVESAFSLKNPRAVAYVAEHGSARVTGITETTRAQLRTLLTRATAEGWSYGRTASAIRGQFEGFAGRRPQKHIRSRARLIAVQEVGDAYEAGSRLHADVLAEGGMAIEKSYLTVGDDRVSAACRGNQAAGWINLDAAFSGGVQRPPQHVACRCTALYRKAKEVD